MNKNRSWSRTERGGGGEGPGGGGGPTSPMEWDSVVLYAQVHPRSKARPPTLGIVAVPICATGGING